MKQDPRNYQIIVNGRAVSVADATREELQNEIMKAFDIIEKVDEKLEKISSELDKYIKR